MLKKILVGAMILGAVVFSAVGYGTYKLAGAALEAQEPKLVAYMQLDEAAQDKYVFEHADEILTWTVNNDESTPADKANAELFKKANANPEVQQALTELGRSVMAKGIMASDNITKDMSATDKTNYQKEADQLKARFNEYLKVAAEAEPQLNQVNP